MSSLLFHLYILLAILVLYNLYTLIAIFLLPVSSDFPTQTLGATPYEYLMFTQQWPKAVNENSPLTKFTIHGLWPSKFSGKELICEGTDFSESEMIEDLQETLQNLPESWPDVVDGNDMPFWKREYNKHGKCCDDKFSQTDYFEFSHNKWKELDIARMLEESDIVPGQNYNSSKVVAAIKKETKCEPNLRCDRMTQKILRDVVVCYDHGGVKMIDCDPNKTTCGDSIYYT